MVDSNTAVMWTTSVRSVQYAAGQHAAMRSCRHILYR